MKLLNLLLVLFTVSCGNLVRRDSIPATMQEKIEACMVKFAGMGFDADGTVKICETVYRVVR